MDSAAAVQERNRERAIGAYTQLRTAFYMPGDSGVRERYPPGDRDEPAYLWPLGQALAAANDLASLPGVGDQYVLEVLRVTAAVERYWDEREPSPGYASAPPLDRPSDRYYDDNAWVGLELVRAHRLTGDARALQRARHLFAFLVSGWDHDSTHLAPGGIYWVEAGWNHDRNTVSTAPAAELGLLLHELTDDPVRKAYYLEWSLRMYGWVYAYMRDDTGLFWDRIDLAGNLDTTLNSYNQGAMIGANVLLYRVTGDDRYLDRAEWIAAAALQFYGGANIFHRPLAHNAIFFHHLLLLHEQRPAAAYLEFLTLYADWLWDTWFDVSTGMWWATQPWSLLEQAAAVRIYAMLAGAPATGSSGPAWQHRAGGGGQTTGSPARHDRLDVCATGIWPQGNRLDGPNPARVGPAVKLPNSIRCTTPTSGASSGCGSSG